MAGPQPQTNSVWISRDGAQASIFLEVSQMISHVQLGFQTSNLDDFTNSVPT